MTYATGDVVVAVNDLVLTTRQLPASSLGYFLASLSVTPPAPVSGSAGLLCLGGGIGRLVAPGQVLSASFTGTVRLSIGTLTLPQPTGSVPVVPGQTWYFQYWHRDLSAAGDSNFSNAVRVVFR